MNHTYSVEDTEKRFKTDIKNGLSSSEAKKRLSSAGKNILKEKKDKNLIFLFFEQFNDFLIIILIAAACLSFFTNIVEKNGEWAEPVVILSIIIFNAFLGVIQERRAEKSIDALKKMTAPAAYVIRDGTEKSVVASDIVPGDIVVLRSGNVAPADMRLFEAVNAEADESALTGESVPVTKNCTTVSDEYVPLAERTNMVYSGTYITGGFAKGIVTATGMNTEVGKIAGMLSETESVQTPLQKKLDNTGKCLGICALLICAFVFVIGVWHKLSPFDMFVTSVSLAVAAIPEGLPAIVTIMLSLGVQKMAKSGAIVRNLPAVETLGSADIICTDKTGTLTKNQMTVQEVYGDMSKTVEYGVLCSAENTKNPTELAIKKYAELRKINPDYTKKTSEEPFSSKTKEMRVMYGKLLTVKGAPEIILNSCISYSDGSAVKPITPLKKSEILTMNKKFAEKALRVIAVAYSPAAKNIHDRNLIFCGLVAMSDPPRPDAIEAVKLCKEAGIKPVMITGDHVQTACAIALETGILSDGGECITGSEIDRMSDEDFENRIENCCVFARTSPEHKIKIVKAFQKKGKIVAMTGDGVNDAPALKGADVGCGLGKSGTDVAKASSDIVLTDDNFATIIKSVRMGREIYSNIRKAVKFLLSSNIGEIFTVFCAILFGWPAPLAAMQLLWINLVTDSLPAIALGVDKSDEDLLLKGKNTDTLFTWDMTVSIILEGIMIGALGLVAFFIGMKTDIITGRTMSFCVLGLSQLVHSFNMRSNTKSVLKGGITENKILLLSFIVGVIMQIGVVCLCPSLFGVVMLTLRQWQTVAALSIVPLIVIELQKLVNRKLS